MISVRYANALTETLYYLKGIRQEDIDKIPKKFMSYMEENCSKDYVCNFDYNKPLKELDLLEETRGIIGMICYNYWCRTKEEKTKYLSKLQENERAYQETLNEKFNPDNLFKKKENTVEYTNTLPVEVEHKSVIKRVLDYIKKFLHIK